MDGRLFDSVARSLGAASTRRAAVAGLLAAVLPFTAEARRRKQGKRDGRLSADGPCGDGGPTANRCRRDRDCCTRICNKRAGRKTGRCRCRRAGQRCDSNRNCCQRGRAQRCQEGRCRPVPTALTCDPTCDQEQRQYCNPDTGTCCGAIDASCIVPSDCCVYEGDNPFACVGGECNFCDWEGTPCGFAGTCCSQDCRDGQCYCEPLGAPCNDARTCCGFQSNSVSCVAGQCCLNFFEACESNEECCDGGCVNGICNA